jgi:hypothetical protein
MVHLGNPQKRRGFSGLPDAAACGGRLYRQSARTTNGVKCLKKEIKRRTRVATLFPNEASLLRLVSAVLGEISDEWEFQRTYPTMETRWPTTTNPQ